MYVYVLVKKSKSNPLRTSCISFVPQCKISKRANFNGVFHSEENNLHDTNKSTCERTRRIHSLSLKLDKTSNNKNTLKKSPIKIENETRNRTL